ncbi:RecQ family ATP-dependent DNA helicase [Micromonospora sp. AP08]|uniref:RecQ family ATP-dependent DNA helicase n=1 Tax=Micromonospora sp. AP08 TaxID=2604467 RepID=UPI0011D7CF93|nr:RecQ family ATP-dependent DNA helicase [Micromonospora sp. AP08]TYB40258.1 RecQ family ATP-dependent DNA helicase [Micromonospora sp. AP08]
MMTIFRSWRLRRAARRHFGWHRLRDTQMRAMRALLAGRDALVVLPTGGGKSAVYQVPATLLRGPTVVISPLLALQQDQISNLNQRDDPALRAVRISSAESQSKQEAALAELRSGTARFLFITPEQLSSPERLAQVRALRPALVAVDEAHCISSWGHDFRPDYLSIGHLVRGLGRPPVVALTATASPPVRDDITTRLGMRKPRLVLSGLDRPNLFVAAAHCPSEDYRWRRLLTLLKEADPPGIVYVPTRRAAEDLAQRLSEAGYPAQAYHGGMAAGLRRSRHEDFLADRIPIMVATSAFGMGIDKPNIRWVAHVALPDSPDSYLQEIGRAGRDGEPARALLLYRAEDIALQRFFKGGAPDLDELRTVAATLHAGPVTRSALAKATGLSPRKIAAHLSLLEQVGAATTGPRGELRAGPYAPLPDQAAREALAEYGRYQAGQRSRTDMMRRFAESRGCRMQSLLGYFGEQLSRPCGHCDNCQGGTSEALPGDGPYPLHSLVRHPKWGSGMVLGYEKDRMTVLFDEVGYKTLSVSVVQAQGLLALEAHSR